MNFSMVHINLSVSLLNRELFLKLKKILLDNKGKSPVYLHLIYPDERDIVVSTDNNLTVEVSDVMISEIESLFGENVVSLK